MRRREFLAMAGATLATGISTQASSQAQAWDEACVEMPVASVAPAIARNSRRRMQNLP